MTRALTFSRDGAQRIRSASSQDMVQALDRAFSDLPPNRAGIRLRDLTILQAYLGGTGEIGAVASSVLGPRVKPVRAVLFNKTAATNWALGWHQDRTIMVRERRHVPGYGPWTVKDGLLHVAPPFEILAGMVTLRVHLDPVPVTNAPLLIAPGFAPSGARSGTGTLLWRFSGVGPILPRG